MVHFTRIRWFLMHSMRNSDFCILLILFLPKFYHLSRLCASPQGTHFLSFIRYSHWTWILQRFITVSTFKSCGKLDEWTNGSSGFKNGYRRKCQMHRKEMFLRVKRKWNSVFFSISLFHFLSFSLFYLFNNSSVPIVCYASYPLDETYFTLCSIGNSFLPSRGGGGAGRVVMSAFWFKSTHQFSMHFTQDETKKKWRKSLIQTKNKINIVCDWKNHWKWRWTRRLFEDVFQFICTLSLYIQNTIRDDDDSFCFLHDINLN